MKPTLLALCSILLATASFAQSTSSCSWGIRDVSAQRGFYGSSQLPNVANINAWFPKSKYLAEQANWRGDFTLNTFAFGQQTSLGATILQAPLKFSTNAVHQLRVSAVFGSGELFSGGNRQETTLYFDTLRSNQGAEVPYEKYLEEWVYVSAGYRYVGASVDYRLLFNADGRWSFYGGVGALFGATYGVHSEVYKHSIVGYKDADGKGLELMHSPSADSDFESEQYTISSGTTLGFHLPVGINFRIGKNREFWRHWSLTYELNNQFYQVKNLPDELFSYRVLVSGGLKYTF